MRKGPKSISTVPPRSNEVLFSSHDHKFRSGLWTIWECVAYGVQMPPLFLPPALPFSAHCTVYLLEEAKICHTYQRAQRWGSCREAKSPPIQRMLITCVLSQAEPGHPLWIKREIVSCSLIFHCPEMFSCLPSSKSCAKEIIQAHSVQRNPSVLGGWTTSPWIPEVTGGLTNLKCSQPEPLLFFEDGFYIYFVLRVKDSYSKECMLGIWLELFNSAKGTFWAFPKEHAALCKRNFTPTCKTSSWLLTWRLNNVM